jgi:single-strand DNA-binding protein
MTIQTGLYTLGRDAEVRFMANGDAVASLSLAYNYGKKDAQGKQPTQWIDASFWGKRAEALSQYLVKGKEIFAVLDDVHIETYKKKDGTEGFKLAARVSDLTFVKSGAQQAAAPRTAPAVAPKPSPQHSTGFDDMDDDIPF